MLNQYGLYVKVNEVWHYHMLGLQPGRPAAAGGEGHRGWNLVWKHRRDHRDQRQVS